MQAEALDRTNVLARSLALWQEEHQLLRLAARGLRALLNRTLAAAWSAWRMLHQASPVTTHASTGLAACTALCRGEGACRSKDWKEKQPGRCQTQSLFQGTQSLQAIIPDQLHRACDQSRLWLLQDTQSRQVRAGSMQLRTVLRLQHAALHAAFQALAQHRQQRAQPAGCWRLSSCDRSPGCLIEWRRMALAMGGAKALFCSILLRFLRATLHGWRYSLVNLIPTLITYLKSLFAWL